VLNHARKTNPWLLVIGRIGIHSPKEETDLGSNTDNLFRNVPCDVLLTTRLEYPALDVKAEESIRWTEEAEERMQRVPPLVVASRDGDLRLAIEKGHSVITSDLLDEAMQRYMPKGAKAATKLAETVVLEHAKDRPIAICKKCGVSASEPEPVVCTVCGGKTFQTITPAMIAAILEKEGGAEAETTYDGRKLAWSRDAKRALWTIQDGYKRRRTKARIEKAARLKRMATVALEFARVMIEGGDRDAARAARGRRRVAGARRDEDGKKLVARDEKRTRFFSELAWTDEAAKRVLRVPAGFMRNRTSSGSRTWRASGSSRRSTWRSSRKASSKAASSWRR